MEGKKKKKKKSDRKAIGPRVCGALICRPLMLSTKYSVYSTLYSFHSFNPAYIHTNIYIDMHLHLVLIHN